MLCIPLFIITSLVKGLHKIARLIALPQSFKRRLIVFLLYVVWMFFKAFDFINASARIFPLSMALLSPSNELALINPAASPIRNTLSFPVQKSFIPLGLETRHASVLIDSPKEFPRKYAQIQKRPL